MKQYVVDAFTEQVFGGNPAAVCILEQWPPEETMQRIAAENNLSETAFAVKEGSRYGLRWFTPAAEVDLCGHATLACGYVLFRFYEPGCDAIEFDTQSGPLMVRRQGQRCELDFPGYTLRPQAVCDEMAAALGARPREAWLGRDLLCVFDSEQTVRGLAPDMQRLLALPGLLVHATAPGKEADCVSRSFAPKLGVPEDPVCGSGHCHIVPYWAGRLGRTELVAYQASRRGGTLYCRLAGGRVRLAGAAALYCVAETYPDGEV